MDVPQHHAYSFFVRSESEMPLYLTVAKTINYGELSDRWNTLQNPSSITTFECSSLSTNGCSIRSAKRVSRRWQMHALHSKRMHRRYCTGHHTVQYHCSSDAIHTKCDAVRWLSHLGGSIRAHRVFPFSAQCAVVVSLVHGSVELVRVPRYVSS